MREVIFEEVLDGLKIDRVIWDDKQPEPSNYFDDEYEIFYLLNGECYFFIEKETYYVKKGSLVLINKGLLHKTSFSKDTLYDRIWILIREDRFKPFFSFSEFEAQTLLEYFTKYNGVFELNEEEQRYVEKILFGMVKEISNEENGYEWMTYVLLAELFIFIMRRRKVVDLSYDKTLSPKHIKVEEIADYIVRNFHKEQSLERLSEQFLINKYYLSRVFKEITGFTVTEYINLQRMKKARELLTDKTISISGVSELLGYESVTYFERVFKRYMRLTPLKYRNKLLQEKL